MIAEYLSDGAREILRQRNMGYFDSSGSLFLKYRQWLIHIDRPAKESRPRRTGSLFTGAREQVVHGLLQSARQWHTGLELADLAQTSAYTVSLTLQECERLEWVESEGSGRTLRRRVAQPAKLLDAWAEAWRARKEASTRWYTYIANPTALMSTLADRLDAGKLDNWAFTGAAAANALAPLLTSVDTVELMIPPGSATAYTNTLELKQADKGANVTLIERSGAATLFCHQPAGFSARLASPIVLYLDLLDGRGRNKELASQLRADILKL